MSVTNQFDTLRYDFHMHSSFSADSEASMEQMVLQAIRLGLHAVCFTEHVDYDWPEGQGTFLVDHPAFFSEIRRLRAIYEDQLEICAGVELGMQPQVLERCHELSKSWQFDYLLASQHLVLGQDPYYPSFWENKDPDTLIRSYFESALANLSAMKEYDSFAHFDYACRYVTDPSFRYDWTRFQDLIDQILQLLIRHDKCLEINSGGLRKIGQSNPCEGILRRYRELGGHLICIGSDAHTPADIANPFSDIYELLVRCGFDSICSFRYDPGTQKRIRRIHRFSIS